ncbi:MAG: isopenicillin N synthase family dioxygenase [Paracoccaceae bacterium]
MEFASFNLNAFEASRGRKRLDLAAKLDGILMSSGFLLLSGHGVPNRTIENQWAAVSAFFDQSSKQKAKISAPYPGYPYGWIGPDKEALAASKGEKTPPDLKESFNGGPLHTPDDILDPQAYDFCYQPTLWPELDGFKAAWTAYYGEMEQLATRLMSAFAEALKLERTFFNKFIDAPISALRALNYPATQGEIAAKQQRAGAHTDYGSLTILLPEAGSSGLQIFLKGAWITVPAQRDCFIINIGDLMSRWTSDRWVSTLHRVVALPDQPSRKSLAFFHQPNWDADIVPLDNSNHYAVVKSGPYLVEKFKASTS